MSVLGVPFTSVSFKFVRIGLDFGVEHETEIILDMIYLSIKKNGLFVLEAYTVLAR